MVGMEAEKTVRCSPKHAPEKRARLRAAERRYLETHPDKYQAKLARYKERYATDLAFRAEQIARAQARNKRVRAAQAAAEAALDSAPATTP